RTYHAAREDRIPTGRMDPSARDSVVTAEMHGIGEVGIQVGILVLFDELVDNLELASKLGPNRRQERTDRLIETNELLFPPRARIGRVIPIERRVVPTRDPRDLVTRCWGERQTLRVDRIVEARLRGVVVCPEARSNLPIKEKTQPKDR